MFEDPAVSPNIHRPAAMFKDKLKLKLVLVEHTSNPFDKECPTVQLGEQCSLLNGRPTRQGESSLVSGQLKFNGLTTTNRVS